MKYLIIIAILLCPFYRTMAQPRYSSFAIVVDSISYQNAKKEIDAYAASVEKDGLKTVVIIDRWRHPDSIRATLIKLYHSKVAPIEGAVFIGDIPIPMVRDAQHLASAFKMDQDKFKWQRSSVPSDRFYDDFDLQFEFLKRDSLKSNFFYYSLQAKSPQKLNPEIYTGRIKPFETLDKYDQLKAYLTKVVRLKSETHRVDNVLYFGGHGYNSESMVARSDEKISLLEQFPWLKAQRNGLEYINHDMDEHIKPRLLSELQRNNLDIAILHHHGEPDAEYLNGMPKVNGVDQQIEGVKYYLRSKLRYAKQAGKDTSEIKEQYQKRLNVPGSWFNGSFDQHTINEDSIFSYDQDIHLADVKGIVPNARFIILDACFNGSFQLDEYQAGAYIFNTGNTVAVQANSANVLQDKWANEFLGLIGSGIRVGNWSRLAGYLETNIIGDPTFRFSAANPKVDMNAVIVQKKTDTNYWVSQLQSAYPDIQALALRILFDNHYPGMSDLLFQKFKESPDGVVRMECLKLLTAFNDYNFIECLKLSLDDSYELVQRQAVYLSGRSGDDRLIPAIIKVAMRNNTTERIEFTIKESLTYFQENKLLEEFDRQFEASNHYVNQEKIKQSIKKSIRANAKRWVKDVQDISNPASPYKQVKFGIRMLRNNNYHPAVDDFCKFIYTQKDEYLRVAMIEALGWFNISCKKDQIIKACKEIAADSQYSPRVRNESIRTINRLQSLWYR